MLTPEDIQTIRQIFREEIQAAANGSRLLSHKDVTLKYGISRSKLYRLWDEGMLFPVKLHGSTKWRESDLKSLTSQLKVS